MDEPRDGARHADAINLVDVALLVEDDALLSRAERILDLQLRAPFGRARQTERRDEIRVALPETKGQVSSAPMCALRRQAIQVITTVSDRETLGTELWWTIEREYHLAWA